MSTNPNNDELIKNALRQGDGLVENVFNSIKSQHELNTCNDGKRSSDVLLSTIEELEKVKKENEELKAILSHGKLTIEMWHTCYDKAASEFNSKIKLAKNIIFLLSVLNVVQLILGLLK